MHNYELRTDEDGYAELKARIPENVTSFLASAESSDRIYTQYIYDPEKKAVITANEWQSKTQNLTNGVWGFFDDTTIQWPIRSIDNPLKKGKWRIQWHSPDHVKEILDVSLITATDDNWSAGELSLSVCFGNNLLNNPDALEAVEKAVDHLWGLYASQNIQLLEHPCGGDFPSELVFLGEEAAITELRTTLPPATVVLLIGDWIGDDPYQLGFSGSIPGPLISHPRSYVGVAWLAHAGFDGVFSDMEIRMMGETMGHEIGHYLGLFHPVELDFSSTDALEDTPDCVGYDDCSAEYQNHLMHASPVCILGNCAEQYSFTPQQLDIMHRHTAVY